MWNTEKNIKLWQLSASSRLVLNVCYRSFPARGLSIDSRANAYSLHALWPIKTLRPPYVPIRTFERSARLGDQRWILFTHPRVKTEQERHLVTSLRWKFFSNTFPPSLIRLLAIVHSWYGEGGGVDTWLGIVRRTNRGWGCAFQFYKMSPHDFHA